MGFYIPIMPNKNILNHYLIHIPPLRIGEIWVEMKLNEPGRQKPREDKALQAGTACEVIFGPTAYLDRGNL